ncbi:1,2-dihydroxy-3-keto-5-methylthiopentene dioxygenase [Microbispora sp. H10949]|uniref:1,2-dihydroxy-3-keto-5-methylthiopentene dioxygenase n=1 Tax=Microbispora sp. H10949 TaxID=2729111 RepID=UPI0016036839|nr:cupin domain-containing protein [Microbispora sp. H10949]
MTMLRVFAEDGRPLSRTRDQSEIARQLAPLGIRFEQWAAAARLSSTAGQDEVLEAYRADVDRLSAENGYRLVDVVRMHPGEADASREAEIAQAREKFLSEHAHAEDEVRFFVEGRGCFYLHLDDRVYAVVCEAGDLLGVPAGTRHWFDMGRAPHFCAIRFFQEEDGWLAEFTGNPIATRIPYLDELLAPVP